MGSKSGIPPWNYIKALLIPLFIEAEIYGCELQNREYTTSTGTKICSGGYAPLLTFAHSLKRNTINTLGKPYLMEEVIRACSACHKVIEDMGEEPMSAIVRETIAKRPNAVKQICSRK